MAIRFNNFGPIKDRIDAYYVREARSALEARGLNVNLGDWGDVEGLMDRVRSGQAVGTTMSASEFTNALNELEDSMRGLRGVTSERVDRLFQMLSATATDRIIDDSMAETLSALTRGSDSPISRELGSLPEEVAEQWDRVVQGAVERIEARSKGAGVLSDLAEISSQRSSRLGGSTLRTSLRETSETHRGVSVSRVTLSDDEVRERMLGLEAKVREVGKAHGIAIPEGGRTNMAARLPREASEAIRKEYEELLKLGEMVEDSGVGRWVVRPDEAARLGSSSSAFSSISFDADSDMGLVEAMYSNIYLRYQPDVEALRSHATGDLMRFPAELPSVAALDQYIEQARGMRSGQLRGSQAIFDLETSGLSVDADDVWQWSIRYSDSDKVHDLYFPSDRMRLGAVGDGRSLMDSVMEGKRFATVDDMKDAMRSMLRQDYLVGHNIDKFDTAFLLGNLEKMGKSVSDGPLDDEFLSLVTQLSDKFHRGETIDTLSLMRTLSSDLDLPIAREIEEAFNLGMGAKKVPYSMENILLQTNLLPLMREHYGDSFDMADILSQVESRGLHYADIDTIFERGLANPDIFKNLRAIESEAEMMFPGLGPEELARFRKAVVGAQAQTPFLPMPDELIDRPVVEYLADRAGVTMDDIAAGRYSVDITPYEYNAILQRMRAESAEVGVGSFNPHLSRSEAGAFAEFLDKRGLTVDDFISSDVAGYSELQEFLVSRGMPFAELSAEERRISGILSQMGTPVTPKVGAEASQLMGDVLPTINFFASEGVTVVGRSGTVAMSKDILERAEQAGVFTHAGRQRTALRSGEEMFSLSPFTYTYRDRRVANISKDFRLSDDIVEAHEEIDRLVKFLRESEKVPADKLERVRSGLRASLERRGGGKIQVGLARPTDVTPVGPSIDDAYEALVKATGGDPMSKFADESVSIRFMVGDIGEAVELPTGHRIQRTGPAMLGDTAGVVARSRYKRDAERTGQLLDEVIGLGETGPRFRLDQYRKATNQRGGTFAGAAIDAWRDYIAPNKAKLGVGMAAVALAVGVGLYHRKAEEDAWFTDTRAHMGFEDPNDYPPEPYEDEYGMRPIEIDSQSFMDPMSTVDIVSGLDYNKTRRTTMGSGKHEHLFAH